MSNPYRYFRICAWGGPILLIASILFWGVLGQNIPPFSAGLDPQAFADQFRPHAIQIRIGMIGELVFTAFYLTWGVAITKVMEAVERDNNVLSTLQVWGAGFTTIIFALACTTWLTATFRAETINPELLQTLYDMGWIEFDMAFSLTTLQLVALGVCFLTDSREVPLFPRWVSWFSIWMGFTFFMLIFMPFFWRGPFSRSGVINYWIEFPAFFLFMATASMALFRAIDRLELERAQPDFGRRR